MDVDGRILKSNATYVNGSRVTLMQIDFDKLFADETGLQKLQAAPDVTDAAAKIDSNRLVGYIVGEADPADVRAYLVANLPEQYRNALTRKYVDGESLETLAGELGISVEAAKSLLARARRAFRDTFATLSANFSEVAP